MGILTAIMVPHPPLIIPAVGRGKEAGIQKTIDAYHEAARRLAGYQPETIVLFSPHQVMYADYFHISPGEHASGDFSGFGAGKERFEVDYDSEFVGELCRLAEQKDISAGTLGERDRQLDHGTMVPLYFVNQYLKNYRLVRIGLSGLPLSVHYRLGQCVKETAEKLGRSVALIASGDLSHRLKEDGPYGYRAEGPQYDTRVMDVMERAAFGELFDFSGDFLDGAGECGHRSFVMMSGALDRTAVRGKRLSYEGPFGVGYGVCVYEVEAEADRSPQADSGKSRNFLEQYERRERERLQAQREKEDAYVRLARRTIEAYIGAGENTEVPDDLPQEMYERQAGVFVSIKEDGRLRGCIGTIHAACASIAQEIIANAVSAASRDPRFSPIRPDELPKLVISVDVLGDTEPIASPEALDVKRYGVVVTNGYRRGLLLPNLDGVDTVEQQIAIARQKAGIREDEEVELERFEVVRHY